MHKQQTNLQEFFTDFFSYDVKDIGVYIVTGIMEFILGIFLWIPYQTLQSDFHEIWHILLLISICGAFTYLLPYIQFMENKHTVSIYEKLKYLPVSLKELRLFRLRKLTLFCLKAFGIFLTGQILFSLVFYHEIVWGNIWYPTLFGLIFPFSFTAILGMKH